MGLGPVRRVSQTTSPCDSGIAMTWHCPGSSGEPGQIPESVLIFPGTHSEPGPHSHASPRQLSGASSPLISQKIVKYSPKLVLLSLLSTKSKENTIFAQMSSGEKSCNYRSKTNAEGWGMGGRVQGSPEWFPWRSSNIRRDAKIPNSTSG